MFFSKGRFHGYLFLWVTFFVFVNRHGRVHTVLFIPQLEVIMSFNELGVIIKILFLRMTMKSTKVYTHENKDIYGSAIILGRFASINVKQIHSNKFRQKFKGLVKCSD